MRGGYIYNSKIVREGTLEKVKQQCIDNAIIV